MSQKCVFKICSDLIIFGDSALYKLTTDTDTVKNASSTQMVSKL